MHYLTVDPSSEGMFREIKRTSAAARQDAKAIMLDLMNPAGSRRRGLRWISPTRFDEASHREGFLIGTAMASTLTAFSIASADTAPFLSSSTILWSASYISGARAIPSRRLHGADLLACGG
jgi:hypothetical protein